MCGLNPLFFKICQDDPDLLPEYLAKVLTEEEEMEMMMMETNDELENMQADETIAQMEESGHQLGTVDVEMLEPNIALIDKLEFQMQETVLTDPTISQTQVPQREMPQATLPQVDLSQVELPLVKLPQITMPEVSQTKIPQAQEPQPEGLEETDVPIITFPEPTEAPAGMPGSKPSDWNPMQKPVLKLPSLSEAQLHWMSESQPQTRDPSESSGSQSEASCRSSSRAKIRRGRRVTKTKRFEERLTSAERKEERIAGLPISWFQEEPKPDPAEAYKLQNIKVELYDPICTELHKGVKYPRDINVNLNHRNFSSRVIQVNHEVPKNPGKGKKDYKGNDWIPVTSELGEHRTVTSTEFNTRLEQIKESLRYFDEPFPKQKDTLKYY